MMYKNWSGIWTFVADSFSNVFGFVSPTKTIEDTYFDDVKEAVKSSIEQQTTAYVVVEDSFSNVFSVYVPAIHQSNVTDRIVEWGKKHGLKVTKGSRTRTTLMNEQITLVIERI